jgi:hypothetical protein
VVNRLEHMDKIKIIFKGKKIVIKKGSDLIEKRLNKDEIIYIKKLKPY